MISLVHCCLFFFFVLRRFFLVIFNTVLNSEVFFTSWIHLKPFVHPRYLYHSVLSVVTFHLLFVWIYHIMCFYYYTRIHLKHVLHLRYFYHTVLFLISFPLADTDHAFLYPGPFYRNKTVLECSNHMSQTVAANEWDYSFSTE